MTDQVINTNSALHQELDSVMGTATRVPRLLNHEGFYEWKFRFKIYVKMKDAKVWRSIMRGPRMITYKTDEGEIREKPVELFDEADHEKVEEDKRALATITMALSPEIAQGFLELTSAKALWLALIEVYEGNKDMKRSRQDLLRQKFNMFNHVLGESLEVQLQRFVKLITEMRSANIYQTLIETNNKLINSLPQAWDMNVAVIKKTKDLSSLSLSEVIAIIKSCDMDDKQRAINHENSYNAAGYVVSSNNALMSQDNFRMFISSQGVYSQPQQPSGSFCMFKTNQSQSTAPASQSKSPASVFFQQSSSQTQSQPSGVSSKSQALPPAISKETQENIALMAGFMNCCHAFLAGDLVQPLGAAELDQITLMMWKKWISPGRLLWLFSGQRSSQKGLEEIIGTCL